MINITAGFFLNLNILHSESERVNIVWSIGIKSFKLHH
jgi:hypothetical protein